MALGQRLLVWFVTLFGAACIAIALAHVAVGSAAIVGAEPVSATLDSEDRFFAALFGGFGAALVWCARDLPARSAPFAMLLGVFFLGGCARVISLVSVGAPHPFHIALMTVELGLPPLLLAWQWAVVGGPTE